MALSTIEQAFALARSGQVPDFVSLKHRLKSDGCRAVDALLAPRILSGHLAAICAATFKPHPTSQPPAESSPEGEPDGDGATPE
ncbi:MAG: hypothetical protein ACXU82_21735 [Caulobacteraceae bacterium]